MTLDPIPFVSQLRLEDRPPAGPSGFLRYMTAFMHELVEAGELDTYLEGMMAGERASERAVRRLQGEHARP